MLASNARRFGRIAWTGNVTGLAAMLAYNMLLGVVPVALLGLFIAGHVLASHSVMQSVQVDLRDIFPGATQHTLTQLLDQVQGSTTGTGVLALFASLWLASSFWGALDTSFSRLYGCSSRPWLKQKRFGMTMVGVVLLFMIATVTVPTAQSLLKAGAEDLPHDLRHVHAIVYVGSLAGSLSILFCCLSAIYSRVPNRRVPWHAVWPGALAATLVIGVVDYAFPAYLSSISTIAHFGTTVVFIVIVLGWFYVLALVILAGAIMNVIALDTRDAVLARRAAAVADRDEDDRVPEGDEYAPDACDTSPEGDEQAPEACDTSPEGDHEVPTPSPQPGGSPDSVSQGR